MNQFKKYIKNLNKINGWFSADAARIINFLNMIQRSEKIYGNIFEIGVFQGKMTLLLGQFIDQNKEQLIVNDIFGEYPPTTSSGKKKSKFGMRDIFINNYTGFFGSLDSLKIISKSSLNLKIAETTRNCRIFSIDGGHSAFETYSDLKTAKKAIKREGIIILDDYFNSGFPGVSEGTCRFLTENKDIAPLLYCFNKLILVKKNKFNYYANCLEKYGLSEFCNTHSYILSKPCFFDSKMFVFARLPKIAYLMFRAKEKIKQNETLFNILNNKLSRKLFSVIYRPK